MCKKIIFLLLISCCSLWGISQQINITTFRVKSTLNAEVSTWAQDPSSLVLIANKMPFQKFSGYKLLLSVKSGGKTVLGYQPQEAKLSEGSFTVKTFSTSDLISLIPKSEKLKEGSYEIAAQFFDAENKAISKEITKPFTVTTGAGKQTSSAACTNVLINSPAATCHGQLNGVPAYAYIPSFNNTSGQQITSWSITSTDVTFDNGGVPGQNYNGVPTTLVTGTSSGSAIMFTSPAPMPIYFNYTFTFADGSTCTSKVAVDYNNCTTPTNCTCNPWPPSIKYGTNPSGSTNPPTTIASINNGATITLPTNEYLTFPGIQGPGCNGASCPSTLTYEIYSPANTLIISTTGYFDAGTLWEQPCSNTGKYKIVIKAKCGTTACNDFIVSVSKPCPINTCPTCTFLLKFWQNGNWTTCSTTNPTSITCGQTIDIQRAITCVPSTINNSNVQATFYDATNTTPTWVNLTQLSNNILTIPPTVSGTYYLKYEWSNAAGKCGSATYPINITCTTPCACGTWKQGKATFTLFNTLNTNSPVDCGKQLTVDCDKPVTITNSITCIGTCPAPSINTYTIYNPNGTTLSSGTGTTVVFTPNLPTPQPYKVVLKSKCGTQQCDSCVVYVNTKCAPPTCYSTELVISTGVNITNNSMPGYIQDELDWKFHPSSNNVQISGKVTTAATAPFYGSTALGNAGTIWPNIHQNQYPNIPFFSTYRDFYICNNETINFNGIIGISKATLTNWATLFRSFKLYKMPSSTLVWSHTSTTAGTTGTFVTNAFSGSIAATPGQYRFVFEYEKASMDPQLNLAFVSGILTGTSLTNNSGCCPPPPPDCCTGGYWKAPILVTNASGAIVTKLVCGNNTPLQINAANNNCDMPLTISGAYSCANNTCVSKVEYILSNNTGAVVTGTNSLIIPANLPDGNYILSYKVYCGNKICENCKIEVVKKCNIACQCITPNIGLTLPDGSNMRISCRNAAPIKIECNKKYTLNARANCPGNNCPASALISITGPGINILNQPSPVTFVSTLTGTFTATIQPMCGTTPCPPCKIIFVDTCICKTCDTKKIDLKETATPIITSSNASAGYDVLELNYLLTAGPTKITEVKAELVAFDAVVTGKGCQPLVNKTEYSQGQFIQTGNSLSTATDWSPALPISGSFREMQWISINAPGVDMTGGKALKLRIGVPDYYKSDCCSFNYSYCIRLIVRDADCVVCEKLICFRKSFGTYKVDEVSNIKTESLDIINVKEQ